MALKVPTSLEIIREITVMGGKQAACYIIESAVDFTTAEPAHTYGTLYQNTVTGGAFTINLLYFSNGTSWVEYTPIEGWLVSNKATNSLSSYNGSSWIGLPTPPSQLSTGTAVNTDELIYLSGGLEFKDSILDIVTTAVTTGEGKLQSDGAGGLTYDVYGTEFELFQDAGTKLTNSTATPAPVINATSHSLPVGKYEIKISYLWGHDAISTDFIGSFTFGGANVSNYTGTATIHQAEPGDTGADQVYSYSMKFYADVAVAGTQAILLQFASSTTNDSFIADASVTIKRVS